MKVKNLFIFIIISLMIISCKNSSDNKLAYSDVETVKSNVKNKEANTAWTKELEGSRLSENISSNRSVSNEVIITPTILKIFSDYQQPVYPEIIDFGKLDTSKLDEKTKEKINEFSEKISKNIYNGAESYFNNSYIFNYIFFSEEFVSNYKNNFEKDFPYTKEEITNYSKLITEKQNLLSEKENLETADDNTTDENQTEENENIESDNNIDDEQKIKNIKKIEEINKKIAKLDKKINKYNIGEIFNKWIIGEPFYGEKILQIPIRFYCNDGTVDVTLYLNKENNLIYQITIDRWEKV